MGYTFTMSHPELREGEVFFTNVLESQVGRLSDWKSARIGTRAYNVAGESLKVGWVPVFVSRREFEEHFPTVHESA